MPAVNWGTSSLTYAGTQQVAVKQNWATWNGSAFVESPWVVQPNLHCEERVFNLLPSIPTAKLVLHYGDVIAHGATAQSVQAKLDIRGYHVRITDTCPDGTLVWYGFVDEQVDTQGGNGADGLTPTGKQEFVCYGLVQMLAHEYMTSSRWYDRSDPNATVARQSGSSIPFNQFGKPNRSSAVPTGEPSHLFVPMSPLNKLGQLVRPWPNPQFWSSRQILTYIQDYLSPKDSEGRVRIPIRFDGLANVPDWDRPTFQTEGRTVMSLINQVVSPARGLVISTGVDTTTTPDTLVLNVHSTSSATVALTGGVSHPANASTLQVTTADAQDTNTVVQASTSKRVQQVIVKGAKRETCLTAEVQRETGTDNALVPAWQISEATAYNIAASNSVGYAALSDEEKAQRNAAVRADNEYADVYKTFVLYPRWNRDLNTTAGSKSWVFQAENPSYSSSATPPNANAEEYIEYHPWWQDLQIKNVLPFKQDFDYTGANPVTDEDAELEFRRPLVLFKVPGRNEYLVAENMANAGSPSWSVEVNLAKDGQGISLNVVGEQQHAIANSDLGSFVTAGEPLPEPFKYEEAKLTISIEEDRYAEGRYPPDGNLPSSADVIRRKIIYAGDTYRKVQLVGRVTVGVNDDGSVKQTQQSMRIDGHWLVDDTDKLKALAQLASLYYATDRKVFRLSSARPSALPAVGQLLTAANGETMNSVVSQISLQTPLSESLSLTSSSYEITTTLGEIDPLQFIPARGRSTKRPAAQKGRP